MRQNLVAVVVLAVLLFGSALLVTQHGQAPAPDPHEPLHNTSLLSPSLGLWAAVPDTHPTLFYYNTETNVTREEVEQKQHASCPEYKKNDARNCYVWTPQHLSLPSSGLSGVVHLSPLLAEVSRQAWLTHTQLLLHFYPSRSPGEAAIDARFKGQWLHSQGSEGLFFGTIGGTTASLDELLDLKNSKSDSTAAYLASRFKGGNLTAPLAAQLFALVDERTRAAAAAAEKKKEKSNTTDAATLYDLAGTECYWLLRLSADSPVAGNLTANLWSTCGVRLSFSTSVDGFHSLARSVALAASVLLLGAVGPFIAGLLHQHSWVHNSRSRCMRVSKAQLLLLVWWTVFLSGVCQFAWYSVREPLRPVTFFYMASIMAEVLTFTLLLIVTKEQTPFDNNHTHEFSSRNIFFIVFVIMIMGNTTTYFLEVFLSPWVAIPAAALLWTPHLVRSVRMDGWTGLTAPFLIGGALLLAVPIVLVLTAVPEPWVLSANTRHTLLESLVIVAVTTGFFTVIRLTGNKRLLPACLAPWRHQYHTTPEAQQAALADGATCVICRISLAEGWEDTDEMWRTPCNHLFHRSCLERWMEERLECPLCRTLLPEP